MEKKVIAIVCGGDSSEHDVSMRSAAGIESFLDKERYIIYKVEIHARHWEAILADGSRVPVDRNDFSFETPEGHVQPDFCYVTIHGAPGENGILQGYLELIGMPYSTCNVLVEAMTYDKFVLNNYMRSFGVSVADSILIRQGQEDSVADEDILSRIGLPCFVKPASGGSSFGTTKVKTEAELRPAIETALREGEDVMVEAFMAGTEVTCGCYKTRQRRISEHLSQRIQTLTSTLYDILGCHGIIRIDYIITEGEKIKLLEINTTPGMTATSFIPQQVRAAGLDIKDVLTEIIEDTLADRA